MSNAPSGVDCPKCGRADMWDNRATKKNPKAPDYKCRDKSCEGVIWPDKKPAQSAPRSTAVTQNFGGYDDEGRDKILGGQDAHESREVQRIQAGSANAERMAEMSKLYGACLNIASVQVPAACQEAGVPLTAEALVAATATLFIAAKERGLAA